MVLVKAGHSELVPNAQNGRRELDFINGINYLEAKHPGIR